MYPFFIYIFYTPLYIYLVYWHDTPLMTPHAFYNVPCFFWCILWMHITSPKKQLLNHISLWFVASKGIMKRWHITPCMSQSFLEFSSKYFPSFLSSFGTSLEFEPGWKLWFFSKSVKHGDIFSFPSNLPEEYPSPFQSLDTYIFFWFNCLPMLSFFPWNLYSLRQPTLLGVLLN